MPVSTTCYLLLTSDNLLPPTNAYAQIHLALLQALFAKVLPSSKLAPLVAQHKKVLKASAAVSCCASALLVCCGGCCWGPLSVLCLRWGVCATF